MKTDILETQVSLQQPMQSTDNDFSIQEIQNITVSEINANAGEPG
jgi:hypothetical protein